MNIHIEKTQGDKNKIIQNSLNYRKEKRNQEIYFVDNRYEAIAQRKLQKCMSQAPIQYAVLQMAWKAQTAQTFIATNYPLLGETPTSWMIRVKDALDAAKYNHETDKKILSNAFAKYYIENIFGHTQAEVFINNHEPVCPQTFDEYLNLNNTPLKAAGYLDINRNILEIEYEDYWRNQRFTQADAQLYFTQNPPEIGFKNVEEYFRAHVTDLQNNWHVFIRTVNDPVQHFALLMRTFCDNQKQSNQQLDNYLNQLESNLSEHIFRGGFNNNAPKGLHAYTNRSIQENTLLTTIGNNEEVHIILWTNNKGAAANKCKWSSMFPISYLQGMVAWHLLRHNNQTTANRPTIGIPNWQNITIGSAGNTLFPIHPNITNVAEVQHSCSEIRTERENGNTVYKFDDSNINYKIDN